VLVSPDAVTAYDPIGLKVVANVVKVSVPDRLAAVSRLTKPAYPTVKAGFGLPYVFEVDTTVIVRGAWVTVTVPAT